MADPRAARALPVRQGCKYVSRSMKRSYHPWGHWAYLWGMLGIIHQVQAGKNRSHCSAHLLSQGTEGLPEDAVVSVIPGSVLQLGSAKSGMGLRVEAEGRASLAGLSGSCTSSGHR